MAWYPFDVQACPITLEPFEESGEYMSLFHDQISYKGELDLSKYHIKQWKFIYKTTATGDGVEGK